MALRHGGRWQRLSRYLSTQVLVQALGFLAGLVMVRAMTQAQYGAFTFSTLLVGVGNVLTELGLVTAVLAIGGRLLPDRRRVAGLVALARRLQLLISVPVLGLAMPLFWWLLCRHQVSTGQALLLTLLSAATIGLNVRNNLTVAVLRLEGDLGAQQRLDTAAQLGRLLLIFGWAALARDSFDASAGVLVNLLAVAALALPLQRWLRRWPEGQPAGRADTRAEAGEDRRGLLDFVRRQAPNSAYYVLSSQLAVWILGITGTVEKVADVGALGRLGAAFALVTAVINAVLQPYFARSRPVAELRRAFLALNLGFLVLLVGLLAAARLVPDPLLWILGGQYAGLQRELGWMLAGATLSNWAGGLYLLGSARTWVQPAWLVVGSGLGSTLLGLWCFDLATVRGVFQLGTVTALASLLLGLAHLGWCLRRASLAAPAGPAVQA